MRHPLLDSNEDLRKRMTSLLSEGLSIRKSGNLLFVCGNNKPRGLRSKFGRFASKNLREFKIFQPEFAMKNYFSESDEEQLDLADFETLIGDLSHAIVIFPEGPGSFAETGYFANSAMLAKKSILVLDADQQKNDSFIMMGPARKFEKQSKFAPTIWTDFKKPDFLPIRTRLRERHPYASSKKLLSPRDLGHPYDLFCLIYKIYDLLIVATMDDVLFFLHSITGGHSPRKKAKDITSILIGADYLKPVGDFGHYFPNPAYSDLVELRTGYAESESSLKIEILEALSQSEPEFREFIEERTSAS